MRLPRPERAAMPVARSQYQPATVSSRNSADRPGELDAAQELHAIHEGVDVGFTDFYRNSWEQIARGLAATIGDRALAAEATDEAMARAYERWPTVGRYDFPAGWVYRVGLNWARSYHRRLARALPLRREEHAELAPISEPSVRSALLDLPVKHRSVIVCRVLLDWSVEETADALHIAPGTVKSRLSRALATLETTLGHLR